MSGAEPPAVVPPLPSVSVPLLSSSSQDSWKSPSLPKMSTGAFSALNFLTGCNQLMAPQGSNLVQVYHHYCRNSVGDFPSEDQRGTFPFPSSIPGFQPYIHFPVSTSPSLPDFKTRSILAATSVYGRRARGEKKPIPDDQKDDRYYERRKRNNQAAKKSRDARKLREDQIALRATLLEHENAILKAQLLTLREETQALRQLVLSHKKSLPPFFPKKDTSQEDDCTSYCPKEFNHSFE